MVDVCINAEFRESGQVILECVVPSLNISESSLEIKEECILAPEDVCVQGHERCKQFGKAVGN